MRLLILTAVVVVVVFSLSGHKEARVMEWIADRSMYTIHGFIVFLWLVGLSYCYTSRILLTCIGGY